MNLTTHQQLSLDMALIRAAAFQVPANFVRGVYGQPEEQVLVSTPDMLITLGTATPDNSEFATTLVLKGRTETPHFYLSYGYNKLVVEVEDDDFYPPDYFDPKVPSTNSDADGEADDDTFALRG